MTSTSGVAAAIVYACTYSKPSSLSATPENTEEKPHHLKDGKGFANPWESWREMTPYQIGRVFLKCVRCVPFLVPLL